jgi:hypothetical protein
MGAYGTERPGLGQQIEVAVNAAQALAQAIDTFEASFPGFATLASELRQWKDEAPS